MTASDVRPSGQRWIDPEVQQCPFGFFEELHAGADPAPSEEQIGRLVHRYEDASQAGACPASYSSNVGEPGAYMGISEEPFSDEVQALVDRFHPMANALFRADPPLHSRQRALVVKALSARRIRALEPMITEIVDALLDRLAGQGSCELNRDFAIPLPLTVIARQLGMGEDHLGKLKEWSDVALRGMIDTMDNEERLVTARAILEYQEYLLPRIRERRDAPREDILSALIHAEIQDAREVEGELVGPRQLTDGEILGIVLQLLVGGNETTTCLIGNAMIAAIERPEAMAQLRADHGLIPNFLEEVLRWDPPVLATTRVTTEPTKTVSGAKLEKGEIVALVWGAANQDASVFPEPRTFDIHRPNAKKHLGFGHGPHFCPGALLSRTEVRIAFERILTRLDDLRLAEGQVLKQTPNLATRGNREIYLEFSAA